MMATAQNEKLETGTDSSASDQVGQDALDRSSKRNWWLVALGPVAGLVLGLILPDSLSFEGRAVAGIALWMAIWWMTEAAPIPVTSLLPLFLFPLFGTGTLVEVRWPYPGPGIFLAMGAVYFG